MQGCHLCDGAPVLAMSAAFSFLYSVTVGGYGKPTSYENPDCRIAFVGSLLSNPQLCRLYEALRRAPQTTTPTQADGIVSDFH